jgi:hypothetical protein
MCSLVKRCDGAYNNCMDYIVYSECNHVIGWQDGPEGGLARVLDGGPPDGGAMGYFRYCPICGERLIEEIENEQLVSVPG